MANELIKAVSQNKKTYKQCRQFIYNKVGNDKNKLIKVEGSSSAILIPYLVKFIESNNIDFKQVISYFGFDRPDLDFWNLIKVSIVGAFRKLERNDTNFEPF